MVREKKSGDLVLVNLFEDTKIERIKNPWEFSRHPRMAVTAMVPGLSVEAEGVGNSKGELDTGRISFKPDVFAIEIAAEQQLTANREATERAQSTVNKSLDSATAAESAAKQARSTADEAHDGSKHRVSHVLPFFPMTSLKSWRGQQRPLTSHIYQRRLQLAFCLSSQIRDSENRHFAHGWMDD